MAVPSAAALVMAPVLLPLLGAVGCFLVPRWARVLAVVAAAAILADVVALCAWLLEAGPVRYRIGGWGAPLGIDLQADGLAAFMLLTTASTGLGVTLYCLRHFARATDGTEFFWPLWLVLWTAMNGLFLSGDVFNVYITLELMGLAAVVLVALAGAAQALAGAMRYLLTTMLASLTYLLGVALLYHHTGTLDIELLGGTLEDTASTWVALGLMVSAVAVKSALFPLHFWLPPAHSNAPPPVSAVLSALVVQATLYLLVRLWLEVVPAGEVALGRGLAVLGTGAIVWGSVQALRQTELKLLVAYSTVAQVGYLFLPFAIHSPSLAATAWRGALFFLLCHALAKAAMFLAVGNFSRLASSGRIDELRRLARQLPVTLFAFSMAGATIIGLPPTGGFLGKWMLIEAGIGDGQWWLAVVVLAGGLLSAAYVFKVVGLAFIEEQTAGPRVTARPAEWIVLALALASVLVAFLAVPLLALLDVGAPLAGAGAPEGPRS